MAARPSNNILQANLPGPKIVYIVIFPSGSVNLLFSASPIGKRLAESFQAGPGKPDAFSRSSGQQFQLLATRACGPASDCVRIAHVICPISLYC